MHKTVSETEKIVSELKEILVDHADSTVGVAPPFTSLFAADKAILGSDLKLCSQNCFFEDKGAFTGEISPGMLKDLGVKYCIVGHSERRHLFGESSELIAKKVKKLLDYDITPVLCIGETKKQRDAGDTFKVLETQLMDSLKGVEVSQNKNIVIAYEPVWAIGTGDTATPQIAQEAHEFIRSTFAKITTQNLAENTIILYGGSVKPENTASLMEQKDINGGLVGGAGLEAKSFSKIIQYRKF